MTSNEKLLQAKLSMVLGEIELWAREWDPEGATRFRKAYWQAFQRFLRMKKKELEKRLDNMKWVEIDTHLD
jgi:hypothetical protein